MISQKIQKALQGSSAIRAMFVEGNELAARVGREKMKKTLVALCLSAEIGRAHV